MKRAKSPLSALRALIREELAMAAQPQQASAGGIGKLIDGIVSSFTEKMKAAHPGADQAVQQEASALKQQLVATVKAAAAKLKASSQPS